MDRDWQVKFISRNYILAIAILAVLSLASFAAMQFAIEAQTRHVNLSLLSSRQAELLNRIQTGIRRIVEHAADPTIREQDFAILQQRLQGDVDEFRAAQTAYIALIDEPERLPGFDLSRKLREIYQGAPLQLAETIDHTLKRAENFAHQDVELLSRVETYWSPLDIGLTSGIISLSAFQKSMDLIEQGSRDQAERLQDVQTVITGVTFVVLFGEVFLIFGPLVRRLRAHNRLIADKQETLDRIAYTDALTGIGNRARFQRDLDEAVSAGRPFALALVDLDRFKAINDGFGHQAGDDLLRVVGARLLTFAQAIDARAARLGGDEFALVVPGAHDETSAASLGDDLLRHITAPWKRGEEDFEIAGSAGIALFPAHALDGEHLHHCADMALYEAKSATGHAAVFDQSLHGRTERVSRLVRDAGRAFAEREFVIHFQPKVRLSDGSIIGIEALVRWQHPEFGLLPPGDFLPAIVRAGRMAELTRYVLDASLEDLGRLRSEVGFLGHVAVNMPEALLANAAGAETVIAALARHRLPSSALTLEITEDVFVNRAAAAIGATLRELSGQGVRVALDDFGTGFASLTHLRSLPFDELKLDRRFVAEIGVCAASEAIVRSMTDLALALGKDMVAEGVETPAQLAFLRAGGCSSVQGYLLSRPLPFSDLLHWLRGVRLQRFVATSAAPVGEVVQFRPLAVPAE